MSLLVHILAGLSIVLGWLVGGQWGSAWRKIGVMMAVSGLVTWGIVHGHVWWHYLPMSLICVDVFGGYGEKSWMGKWLKNDALERLVYSLFLALAVLGVGLLENVSIIPLLASVGGIVVAFQMRLGAWAGVLWGKDLIWDDLMRSGTFAMGVLLVL